MAAPSLRARATPAWRARSTLATSALNSRRRLAGLGLIRPEKRWRVRGQHGPAAPAAPPAGAKGWAQKRPPTKPAGKEAAGGSRPPPPSRSLLVLLRVRS